MTTKFDYLIFRNTNLNKYSIRILIAAILSKFNIKSKIIILNNTNEIKEFVKSNLDKEILLLYSLMTVTYQNAVDEIKYLKERYQNITCICGGPHPTARAKQAIEDGFDHVFVGESEETLISFLNGDIDDQIIYGTEVDINKFPAYAHQMNLFVPFEITRGCLNNCYYCETPNMFKRKIRHRSLENIYKYVKIASEQGYRDMNFITPDSLFYAFENGKYIPEKIEALFETCMKAGANKIQYGCFPNELNINSFNEKFLQIFEKYCTNRKLTFGIQNINKRILNMINRKLEFEKIDYILEILKNSKFSPIFDFIIGFPTETKEEQLENLEYIQKLLENTDTTINLHYFHPLPGTKMENDKPVEIYKQSQKLLNKLERKYAKYLKGSYKTHLKLIDRYINN